MIQRVTSPWTEGEVTWETAPSVSTANQVELASSSAPDQDYLDIDVTNLIQDVVDNPNNSFGFMLSLQEESFYRRMNFASSDHENSALHPKIEIIYNEVTPISTIPSEAAPEIELYPNPVQGDLIHTELKNIDDFQNITIKVFNQAGILMTEIIDAESSMDIPVMDFGSGMYYVVISEKGNNRMLLRRKFIKL